MSLHPPEDLLTAIDAFEQPGLISRSKAIQIGSQRFIETVQRLFWMMDSQLLRPALLPGKTTEHRIQIDLTFWLVFAVFAGAFLDNTAR